MVCLYTCTYIRTHGLRCYCVHAGTCTYVYNLVRPCAMYTRFGNQRESERENYYHHAGTRSCALTCSLVNFRPHNIIVRRERRETSLSVRNTCLLITHSCISASVTNYPSPLSPAPGPRAPPALRAESSAPVDRCPARNNVIRSL